MRKIIEHAESLARQQDARLSTGHLLLALVEGSGTTSKILMNLGMTKIKVLNHLRSLEPESGSMQQIVLQKAEQMAAPMMPSGPGPLHLLTALTSVKGSHAQQVFKASNIDTNTMRGWVLRCLTKPTEQLDLIPTVTRDSMAALPLAEPLNNMKMGPRKTRRISNPFLPVSKKSPKEEKTRGYSSSQTRKLIDLGCEIEKKQRKKRKLQTGEMSNPVPLGMPTTESGQKAGNALEFTDNTLVCPEALEDDDCVGLPSEKYPLLSCLGRNLSTEAATGKLDDIIGRTREMDQIIDVLHKRRSNSPLLVGPAGVGKTAIIEGLAKRFLESEIEKYRQTIIIELRTGDLLSGTSVRGALSQRLADLRREVISSNGRIILFFDEFNSLLSSNDGAEAFQELKASLNKGELPCIAATTTEEYTKQVETDPSLARLFTLVEIVEPNEQEAVRILEGVRTAYEEHHQVTFSPEAITAAVRLSHRYIHERALPDKAISLLDLAGASTKRTNTATVGAEDVARILAEKIGVPAERLASDDQQRLLDLETELSNRIVGHQHVLVALGETLRRNAAGFRTGRPIGSFLFLGPTGVGKTETAKALGEFLFPGGRAFIRLDMSEFSESHSVARLIGAPPGYIGHEEGGQLTEAVRRHPYSLILLDEVEKAHQEVQQILLQVLDDGQLTDGLGRTVNFENTVIVMTSNLGSNLREQRRQVGFGAARSAEEQRDNTLQVIAEARASLPPELWNRIDEPLVFAPLNTTEVANIAKMLLSRVNDQLFKEQGIEIVFDKTVIYTLIATGGYDPDLGARPMRRMIQRYVEGPIANLLLSSVVSRGDRIVISGDGEKLSFQAKRSGSEKNKDPKKSAPRSS